MLRVMTKDFVVGWAILALVVAAGCQQQTDGPPAGVQAGTKAKPPAEKDIPSTTLTEVTLEVTGMS